MRRRAGSRSWLGLVVAISFGLSACNGSAATSTPTASPSRSAIQHGSLTVDGQTRTYRLFRPTSLDSKQPAPLVIALHGAPSTGDEMASISHFDDQATTGGFIAAYPDGIGRSWRAGGAFGSADVDVVFISRLLDRLTSDFAIDRARIFVTGASAGAWMAYRLACELSDRIAAIASVSGAMVVDECRPVRAVSILEIHGTDDVVVPYAGGRSGGRTFPSSATVIQRWVALDGCQGGPSVSTSGITTTSTWKGCRGGTVVTLDVVEGGHHTWFGSAYDPVPGEPNANAEIWNFFSGLGSRATSLGPARAA